MLGTFSIRAALVATLLLCAGAPAAAQEVPLKGLGRFDGWRDAERIAVNVDTLYRGFAGDSSPPDVLKLFERMGRLYYDRKGAVA